jgi:site-specific DNA-methyltransferase (adenine-specific)
MQGRREGDRRVTDDGLSVDGVEPWFAAGGVRMYRGDVLQLGPRLRPGAFSAVITDPPYCSGGTTFAERARDPITKYCQNNNACGRPTFQGDSRDQRSFTWWCTQWLLICRQATMDAGYLLAFIDWRQLPAMTDAVQAAGWTWRGIAPWNKGRGARAPHKGFFRHQCEYVVWATNGRCPKLTHAGPFDGCFDAVVQRKADKFHITGKPTDLMERLIECVPPGGAILDPFAGSFTTGVACALHGRRFTGFELSEENCAIGEARLSAALRGERLRRAS